jgi:two-component system, NtrC family, nitrogen regulation sensor histidine kinase GlnL
MSQREYSGLDVLATAVIMLNEDFSVSYANPAAQNLFELPARAFAGRSVGDIFENASALIASCDYAAGHNCSYTAHDVVLNAPNRARLSLSCTVTPLDTSLARFAVEFQHTPLESKVAKEERWLEQREDNRLFVRNLAHEVRNPLGGIRGAAQLLEGELKSPQLTEYTQVIIKEADRLQSIMDRLLAPSRLLSPCEVNVHEALERARSLVKAEFPAGIVIRRDYDVSLPPVIGHLEQLIQALLNIVRNAAQALQNTGTIVLMTRAGRQITLGKKRHALAIMIQITDNGPGVPDAIEDRIFNPLVSGREGGSGLGLALARELVHQHSGVIECESRPGDTRFTILLPVAPQ